MITSIDLKKIWWSWLVNTPSPVGAEIQPTSSEEHRDQIIVFKRCCLSWNDGFVLPVQSFIFSDVHLTWTHEGLTIGGLRWVRQDENLLHTYQRIPILLPYIFSLCCLTRETLSMLLAENGKTLKWNLCAISRQSTSPFIANLQPPHPRHHHHSFLLSVILLSLSASIFPFVFIYSFVCSCTLHSHSLLRVLWQTCPPLLHSLLLNKVTAKWL